MTRCARPVRFERCVLPPNHHGPCTGELGARQYTGACPALEPCAECRLLDAYEVLRLARSSIGLLDAEARLRAARRTVLEHWLGAFRADDDLHEEQDLLAAALERPEFPAGDDEYRSFCLDVLGLVPEEARG